MICAPIDNRIDITLDTSGEPSFSMQLELDTHLPLFHYLPTPDREVSIASVSTAISYVVGRKQLTLNTRWDKGAFDTSQISNNTNVKGGDEESGNACILFTQHAC
jgi:hypothetical protein